LLAKVAAMRGEGQPASMASLSTEHAR
jgi:hypothetical protein